MRMASGMGSSSSMRRTTGTLLFFSHESETGAKLNRPVCTAIEFISDAYDRFKLHEMDDLRSSSYDEVFHLHCLVVRASFLV